MFFQHFSLIEKVKGKVSKKFILLNPVNSLFKKRLFHQSIKNILHLLNVLSKSNLWLQMRSLHHLITMNTIVDKIVYQVAFSNLLFFRNLSTLLDISNLALVISTNVALLLMDDLLHRLHSYCTPSWSYHSTCSLTPTETVWISWSPTGSLVSCRSSVLVS